jgi:hypothetical protein
MVLKQVKHWMKLRTSASQWKPVADWAAKRGAQFTLEDDEAGDGCSIVEPQNPLGPLLIEWGPPQRDYVQGAELRMRWDLKLKSDLQVMVIERSLMDRLEGQVFEAYTDTLQTRIDTDTPEEMRWLVMFPRLEQWSGKVVKQRFGALGASPEMIQEWLAGALTDVLSLASQDLVPAGHPFVMLTQRGNLYLRHQMPEIDLTQLQGLMRVAEVAAREALSLNKRVTEPVWAPTDTSTFPSSTPPAPSSGA